MLFPQLFARIFTPDEELIAFTGWALRIYLAAMGVFGAQTACQMTFISLGNAKASILVAVMRKFILLIPLIYMLPHFFADKTFAVYLAEPVADFISVVFAVTLFSFQFRKAIREMEEKKFLSLLLSKTTETALSPIRLPSKSYPYGSPTAAKKSDDTW